ncbi:MULTISPECIES: 1-acyl-sn-glycerol-3-phosphate acyltransferase [Leptospira]|uniref:1-acyl-sn-glycerol-3-phosphate acyltransferase n=1 Tax=Leptospira TaxID=171 RepID=UPI0002926C73|nr:MULTISPECIES: 1-acyl-sn-glycerol-3-phosphate acyltransferase [Leptospira]EKO79361.1 NAD-dependent glycerol-3-phosphate dehydrogenase C-terminal domain protein [Leptospira sp. Fiocruz LV3954]EKS08310.1 glycerol-3-phosphate dehydrogenase (NAD(+)) [Leptospira santarosai str. JET]EMF90607.1 glycerol-3-phosphate dehydrogenase (NAD(+)) [Leptospira santarosai str. ST188]EMI66594.1 glycerol-3-phosphate dehydrogenase (NAD(+)) [Leptospira sp. Fiocruz LV4135]EMJ49447.1 NAD-dependent glycerol-3-phospha
MEEIKSSVIISANIAVLGGGPMGIYLSTYLSPKAEEIFLWYDDRKKAAKIEKERIASVLEDSVALPENVRVKSEFDFLKSGSWILVIAVPSRLMEGILDELIKILDKNSSHYVFAFTKGLLSVSTRKKTNCITYSEYIRKLSITGELKNIEYTAVNGPNLLGELKRGHHSFYCLASSGAQSIEIFETLFGGSRNHTKTYEDLVGLEVFGVMKNPIAIACGIASGIPECGSNFEGELISLGYSEIIALLETLGIPTKPVREYGLADLIASCTSRYSRNKAYGHRFVHKLISGEDRPNLIERIELFFNPAEFIQKEVSQSESHVEGAFALASIISLAEEKNVDIPLYNILFQILTRRVSPTELIRFVSKSTSDEVRHISKTATKRSGLGMASGRKFQEALSKNVLRHINGQLGMTDRIVKQSSLLVKSLEKRYKEAEESKDVTDLLQIPKEIELWNEIEKKFRGKGSKDLTKILDFYVSEIADDYKPFLRDTLINLIMPIRYILSGFKLGTGLPKIGGCVKEVKALASRYDILYTPTHRSHLDSIEVAFGLKWLGLPVPRYAADKKVMATPGLANLLKSLGAYMVDRKRNRNILYLECLTQYSTMMLEAGIPTLVYPEGTRSRTGGILPIKTGILSTSVEAYKHTGSEVIVVPIALSYENVPEDEEFCGKDKKSGFRDFFYKRKEVYMDLCEPIPVSRYIHEEDPVGLIGFEITQGWKRYRRILPNQLVARLIVETGTEVKISDLKSLINETILTKKGNYLVRDTDEILKRGLRSLKQRKMVSLENENVKVLDQNLIQYYANMCTDESP